MPEVDTGAPVVDLTAGAGAVWAVTSSAGLLRIDPGTARLTAPNPGPVSAIAAGADGVWAVCCVGRGPRGRVTRLDPAHGRQAGAIRLPIVPDGAELAGELVVDGEAVWVSDPGVASCGGSTCDAEPRTAGRPMGATSR